MKRGFLIKSTVVVQRFLLMTAVFFGIILKVLERPGLVDLGIS